MKQPVIQGNQRKVKSCKGQSRQEVHSAFWITRKEKPDKASKR